MRDAGLDFALMQHVVDRGQYAQRRGTHGRTALVAVRPNPLKKLRAVGHLLQKPVEAAGVARPRIAPEDFDELRGQILRCPRLFLDQQLGDGQAHLSIVRIATRAQRVPRMLDVVRQVVVPPHKRRIRILEARSVRITNRQFHEHGLWSF